MAHFAELDETNTVLRVIVISDSDILDESGQESEQKGIEFCLNLFGGHRWLQTSINRRIRGNFAEQGMTYIEEHDAFMPEKPYPWYEVGEDYVWHRPAHINDCTGLPFTHAELSYIGFFARHTKGYRLCPAVLKDPDDAFTSAACLTNSYMYPTFETITYGTNSVAQAVEHQITGGQVVINTNFTISKYLDVTPIGLIIKTTFEVFTDLTNPVMNMHPQTAARTPHEMFRLIIEWAFAYTDLNNTEAAAKACHDLLRAVQMPIEVRNELLAQVEPQAVERYVRGLDPFYATDISIISDPPMPPLFSAWIQPTRETFKNKVAPPEDVFFNYEVIDYDTLPTDYPR